MAAYYQLKSFVGLKDNEPTRTTYSRLPTEVSEKDGSAAESELMQRILTSHVVDDIYYRPL